MFKTIVAEFVNRFERYPPAQKRRLELLLVFVLGQILLAWILLQVLAAVAALAKG